MKLPPRPAALLALALITASALTSCSVLSTCACTHGPSQAPGSPAPEASLPPSPVDGVVVHVDSAGLADVNGFDLRLTDGTVLGFTLGPLENGAQFAPGHLTEHEATGAPVRVFYRIANGIPVVYRLEDAPI